MPEFFQEIVKLIESWLKRDINQTDIGEFQAAELAFEGGNRRPKFFINPAQVVIFEAARLGLTRCLPMQISRNFGFKAFGGRSAINIGGSVAKEEHIVSGGRLVVLVAAKGADGKLIGASFISKRRQNFKH